MSEVPYYANLVTRAVSSCTRAGEGVASGRPSPAHPQNLVSSKTCELIDYKTSMTTYKDFGDRISQHDNLLWSKFGKRSRPRETTFAEGAARGRPCPAHPQNLVSVEFCISLNSRLDSNTEEEEEVRLWMPGGVHERESSLTRGRSRPARPQNLIMKHPPH